MAYGAIPVTGSPIDSLFSGMNQSQNMFSKMMEQAAKQEQMNRLHEMMPYEQKRIMAQIKNADAASGRASSARQEAHQRYLNEMNPDYAANKFMHEMQMLESMGSGAPEMSGNATPEAQEAPPQFNALRDMMQSRGMPQGQGMMAPEEGLQQSVEMGAPEQPQMQQQSPAPKQQGLDWNNMNPLQKMWAAKHGFKPSAETPGEKQDRAISLYQAKLNQKEAFDQAKELRKVDGEIPLTNAMKTQMQNIISGVPKVKVKIDSLIKAQSPTALLGYKSSSKAVHNALVKETAETYAKAKGWPNTNESIKAAAEILDRHTFESDSAYRERLKSLKKSLDNDFNDAKGTLHPKAIGKQQQSPQEMIFNPTTGRLE